MWTPGVQGPEARSWSTVMGRAQHAVDQAQGQGEPQMAPGAFHQSLSVTVGQSHVLLSVTHAVAMVTSSQAS